VVLSGARRLRLGLALGSGSARGWAHIGIIRALAAAGIRPDVVSGCSIGALVGAAWASGRLEALARAITALRPLELVRFFEIDLSGRGFVDGPRLRAFLEGAIGDPAARIERLERPFAAVATDLESGNEIWLQEGPLLDAAWASFALPGLFPPVRRDGRWLVDGGLVNPVPVSLCRALGAERVIAVNLNGDLVGRALGRRPATRGEGMPRPTDALAAALRAHAPRWLARAAAEPSPSLIETVATAVNIMQDRITRSRMAGDPPDVLLSPQLSHIRLLEFHRAAEAIAEGEACVERMAPLLEGLRAAG